MKPNLIFMCKTTKKVVTEYQLIIHGSESLLDYVWYASYGSNLFEDRFHCYINGGTPEGSAYAEVGCTDKALPLKAATISMPYELYFSKYSKRWHGGVAFIDIVKNPSARTYGKMYLITSDQFQEIVQQENGDHDMKIDLALAKEVHTYSFNQSWYGNILYLGERDGCPIFTFTANEEMKEQAITPPSIPYLRNLYRGLWPLHQDREKIIDYLSSKKGVKEVYSKEDLYEHFPEIIKNRTY